MAEKIMERQTKSCRKIKMAARILFVLFFVAISLSFAAAGYCDDPYTQCDLSYEIKDGSYYFKLAYNTYYPPPSNRYESMNNGRELEWRDVTASGDWQIWDHYYTWSVPGGSVYQKPPVCIFGHEYQVRVRQHYRLDMGYIFPAYWTEWAYDNVVIPPKKPPSLTVSSIAPSSISLLWSASEGATDYIVRTASPYILYKQTSATHYTWTSNTDEQGVIASGTEYTISVYGHNSNNDGLSEPQIVTIRSYPYTPANFNARDNGSFITCTWDDVTGEKGYLVRDLPKENTGTPRLQKTMPSGATTTSLSPITPDTSYTLYLYAYNDTGYSAPAVKTIKTAPPKPSAPSAASATPYSTSAGQVGKIVISWSAAQYAESYEIYYSTVGSSSGFPNPDDPNDPLKNQKITATTTTCDHTGVARNTTYYYRIYSKNVTGRSTTYTPCQATSYNIRPGSPSGLDVTYSASFPKRLSLNWTDASDNEDKFEIERRDYAPVAGDWAYLAETGAGVRTYNDDTVIPGKTYQYRVRAHCPGTVFDSPANNYSNYSGPATEPVPQVAPDKVTGAAASDITQTEIKLTWTDLNNEDSYRIDYATTLVNPAWQQAGTSTANTPTFTHTGRAQNTSYHYRICGINTGGTGPYSEIVSATTLKSPPASPTALTAAADTVTLRALDLRWTDNANNEDGFKIWRQTTNANWPNPAVSTPAITIPTERAGTGLTPESGPHVDSDASLLHSTTYYYRIYSYNAGGISATYAAAQGTTAAAPPAAPGWSTNPAPLVKQVSPLGIVINWTWSQGGGIAATGFKIYRSTTGEDGSFTDIGASIGPALRTYTDTAVTPQKKYYYKVGAQGAVPGINFSTVQSITTGYGLPGVPKGLMAEQMPYPASPEPGESDPIILVITWLVGDGGVTQKYILERSDDNGAAWRVVAGESADLVNTYYSDSDDNVINDLMPNTLYKYRVKARNVDGDSEYSLVTLSSQIRTFNVKPDPAAHLSREVISSSQVKLSFHDKSRNEDGFRIWRTTELAGAPNPAAWGQIGQAPSHEGITQADNPATQVIYNDTACSPNTAYYYKVISFNNEKGDAIESSNIERAKTFPAPITTPPVFRACQAVSRFDINLEWEQEQPAGHDILYFHIVKGIQLSNNNVVFDEGRPIQVDARRGETGTVIYTYPDDGCGPDATYCYKVKAYSEQNGFGNESTPVSATTFKNPPTTLWNIDLKNQFIDLSAGSMAELKIYNKSNEQTLKWAIDKYPSVVSITQTSGTLGANGEIILTVTKASSSFGPGESDYIKVYNADDPADYQYAQVYLGGGSRTIAVTEPEEVICGAQYNINWQDSQAGKAHYIYYSPDGGYNYVMISDPAVNAGANSLPWTLKDAYLDASKDIPNDNHYKIRVASDADYADNIDTFAVGNPMNVVARSSLATLPITLTWQDIGGNGYWTGYEIWEKQSAEHTSYELITTVPAVSGAEDYSLIDEGQWQSLSPAKTNYYRLRAYKDGIAEYSAYSNVAFAKPQSPYSDSLPTQPLNITATAGTRSITLSWQDSQNETGYDIYRKTSLADTWGTSPVASKGQGVTTFQNTGLNPSLTYYYRVKAKNEAGEIYSEIAAAKPLSPYLNLTATANGTNAASLSWTDESTDRTAYTIFRKETTDYSWSYVDEVSAATKSYPDTGLLSGITYDYLVYGYNATDGAPSNVETVTIGNTVPAPPTNPLALPGGFYVKPDASVSNPADPDYGIILGPRYDQIGTRTWQQAVYFFSFAWDDMSHNEDGFYCEFKDTRYHTAWTPMYVSYPDETGVWKAIEWTPYALAPNDLWQFRVLAYNETGDSVFSTTGQVSIPNPATTPPPQPTNLTVETQSATAVKLRWNDNALNEAGYEIELKQGTGNWTPLYNLQNLVIYDPYDGALFKTGYVGCTEGTGMRQTCPIIIYGLTEGAQYQFRIKVFYYTTADNGTTFTKFDNTTYVQSSAVTMPNTTPLAPTNAAVRVDPSDSHSNVIFTWDHDIISGGARGFRVYASYSSDPNTFTAMPDPGHVLDDEPRAMGVRILGLEPGRTIYFAVCAINNIGESQRSYAASPVTLEPFTVTTPTNLTSSIIAPDVIHLTWDQENEYEDEFVVQAAADDAFDDIIYEGSVPQGIHEAYLEASMGATFYFRVMARNSYDPSDWSNIVSATIPVPQPANLTAATSGTADPKTEANLTWASADFIGHFNIEIAVNEAGPWFILANEILDTVRNIKVSGLDPDTTYYFRIQAYNELSNMSSFTMSDPVTTDKLPLASPDNLSAMAVSATEISVTWHDTNTAEDSMILQMSADEVSWTDINIPKDEEFKVIDSLSPHTKYYFRIKALRGAESSPLSATVSAVTFKPVPAAPSGLAAATVSDEAIDLTWHDTALPTDSFILKIKRTGDMDWSSVEYAPAYHNYKLCDFNGDNKVNNADYVELAAKVNETTPYPEGNITYLKYDLVPDGYINSQDAAFFTSRMTNDAEIAPYRVAGLMPGTPYSFKIMSYNASGESTFSNEAEAETWIRPDAPYGLRAEAVSDTAARLNWMDDNTTETGFIVEKMIEGGEWQIAGPALPPDTAEAAISNLNSAATYYFRVKAVNEHYGSTPSVEAICRTFKKLSPGESLQNAVNSAQDGDTILMAAGVYTLPSDIIIDNKAVTIKGNNAHTTVIDAGNAENAFLIEGGSDVALENISIKNARSAGVAVRESGTKALINYCLISGSLRGGISASMGADLTLLNTIVHHNNRAGVEITDAGTTATIVNNVIAHNQGEGGIKIFDGAATVIKNNIIAYNREYWGIWSFNNPGTPACAITMNNNDSFGNYPSAYNDGEVFNYSPGLTVTANNISVDPGFINADDPLNPNYSLEYDSLLLRKGIGVIPAYNEVPGTGNVLTGLFDSQNVHIADIMKDNTILIYHYDLRGALEGTVRALTVGSEDSSHASIQQAVNSAQDKDTILVSSGTYNETIKIENKSLRIIGEGEDKTIINAQSLKYGFHISNNTDVTLANITVKNASSYNIYIGPWSYYTTTIVRLNHVLLEGSNYGIGGVLMNGPDVYHPVCSYVTIDNSKIRYATKTGIELGFDTFRYQTLNENIIRPEYDISIHNTEITNNQRAISVSGYRRSIEITHSVIANNYSGGGIRLYSDGNPYNLLKAYLNYNIISNNTGYGLWLGPTAQAYLNDNVLYSNTQGSIYQYSYNTLHPYLENIEPIDEDPKFIDTSIREYGLKTDSPALKLNTSTLDEDCGMVR